MSSADPTRKDPEPPMRWTPSSVHIPFLPRGPLSFSTTCLSVLPCQGSPACLLSHPTLLFQEPCFSRTKAAIMPPRDYSPSPHSPRYLHTLLASPMKCPLSSLPVEGPSAFQGQPHGHFLYEISTLPASQHIFPLYRICYTNYRAYFFFFF